EISLQVHGVVGWNDQVARLVPATVDAYNLVTLRFRARNGCGDRIRRGRSHGDMTHIDPGSADVLQNNVLHNIPVSRRWKINLCLRTVHRYVTDIQLVVVDLIGEGAA